VSSRRWALDVIFTNYFQFFCSSQNSQEQTFLIFKIFSTLSFLKSKKLSTCASVINV
jgi:hypothetical protein